jgi:hypothetical protein
MMLSKILNPSHDTNTQKTIRPSAPPSLIPFSSELDKAIAGPRAAASERSRPETYPASIEKNRQSAVQADDERTSPSNRRTSRRSLVATDASALRAHVVKLGKLNEAKNNSSDTNAGNTHGVASQHQSEKKLGRSQAQATDGLPPGSPAQSLGPGKWPQQAATLQGVPITQPSPITFDHSQLAAFFAGLSASPVQVGSDSGDQVAIPANSTRGTGSAELLASDSTVAGLNPVWRDYGTGPNLLESTQLVPADGPFQAPDDAAVEAGQSEADHSKGGRSAKRDGTALDLNTDSQDVMAAPPAGDQAARMNLSPTPDLISAATPPGLRFAVPGGTPDLAGDSGTPPDSGMEGANKAQQTSNTNGDPSRSAQTSPTGTSAAFESGAGAEILNVAIRTNDNPGQATGTPSGLTAKSNTMNAGSSSDATVQSVSSSDSRAPLQNGTRSSVQSTGPNEKNRIKKRESSQTPSLAASDTSGESSAGEQLSAKTAPENANTSSPGAQTGPSQLSSSSAAPSQPGAQVSSASGVSPLPVAANSATADRSGSGHPDGYDNASAEKPVNTGSSPLTEMAQSVASSRMVERAGQVEMRVEVRTDALGPVELKATLHGDHVGASLSVQSPEAHTLLTGELSSLRQVLAEHNVNLEHVSVNTTSSGAHNGGASPGSSNSGHSSDSNHRSPENRYTDPFHYDTASTQETEGWLPEPGYARLNVRA